MHKPTISANPVLRSLFLSFFLCFSLSLSLSASETIFLRDRFAKAEEGDYLVAQISGSYTLLHIHTKKEDQLIIEEITIPKHLVNDTSSWRDWVQSGAPGHTGWVMYNIAIHTGEILEFYSFTQRAWSQVSDGNNFISNLLRLEFHKIQNEDRKRIGPAPLPGDLDRRRLWTPPARFEGISIKNTPFTCWRTTWPDDGSELTGKTIEAYLPETGPYPNYFPYWIEVRGNFARASVRVKDTGKNMTSIKKGFPQKS